MDEASLEATIDAYKMQLRQVESALESGSSDGLDALRQLKQDLKDVIELTQGSLLSLRKSNLLSYVDDITGSSQAEEKINNEEKEAPPLDMDEEFAAFQAEIAESSASSSHLPARTNQRPEDDEEEDGEEEEEDGDMNDFEDITGTKCSVLYRHEWGAHQRHNAVVLSVEPASPDDDEARLRVLFCNPTNASMKPCPFFFKGECRFSEEECKFSHGHIVNASELKPFQEVDLSQLTIEGRCLAKYDDDIWYPASVTDIDKDTKQVTICFESYGNSATVDAQNVLPIGTQTASDDDDDEEEVDNCSLDSDYDEPSTSGCPSRSRLGNDEDEEEEDVGSDVIWTPSGPSCKLGEWETHTRGIASKLMAMMGYEIGKGLGKHGEGRTEPVEAVIVPPGKSLDTCMKLREMKKLGIVGKKKKKGKGKNRKKKKNISGNSNATKLKKPKDVFEFINTHLGAKKIKVNELLADNTLLVKTHRIHREESRGERKANTRQLNVQLMKTQEETRSAEKKLAQLRQSLVRNQRDKTSCAAIQLKIQRTEDYLATLKSSQRKLERQKTSRDEHKKLTIF